MNTNIVISLDTRRPKTDGSYPLVMRLGHNRRTIPIPLGISVKEKDWDDKNRVVKKSYEGVETVARLNNLIQKKRSEAMDVVMKLHEEGLLDKLRVSELKDRIYKPASTQSFFQYTDFLIAELKKANKFGTASTFKDASKILKIFNKDKDLSFTQINFQFLCRFETFHLSKNNGLNSLSVYLRSVRSIFNKAIKSGIVSEELYPFKTYKIKSAPTEKRALEAEPLKKILSHELLPGDELFHDRNYFVASYMMYGMNFKDLALLKTTDIKDGRIIYIREKTGVIYNIKLTDSLKAIFSFYQEQSEQSGYVFPIVKRESPEQQHKDIVWARGRYNKRLKKLAETCNIQQNLTSYVSRHSFATQASQLEIPLNAISSMLGHSSLKTTEIYLKSLHSNILDDYNSRILKG